MDFVIGESETVLTDFMSAAPILAPENEGWQDPECMGSARGCESPQSMGSRGGWLVSVSAQPWKELRSIWFAGSVPRVLTWALKSMSVLGLSVTLSSQPAF